MKKIISIFFIFLMGFEVQAQTGPAGVGTSSNNVFWVKADVGTSTSADGSAVNGWNDQSGNGINTSQTNAVQQPIYRSNVLNGFPGIEFDNNSSSGQNDFLTAPDNTILDNTNGYTIFTVSKMKNLDGNARSIVSKRTNVDADEAFMFFYYTSNYMYLDIDGTGDRLNTPVAYVNNTGYIFDAVYDGTLTSTSRSRIYEQEILQKTAKETSASVADKNSPLVLGATHTADNRPFGGYISEVIVYRQALNDASRVIVNNYLSAKYNIALSANDKYAGDNSSNGDYDREVAGVGSESSGSNNAFASSISGGLGISANTGLETSDYLLAGHASPTNMEITSDVDGMSSPYNARWKRIWYIDGTDASTPLSTNVEFNISDGGIASPQWATVSDYVLIYRAAQTGSWTELATATAIVGNKIQFSNINFAADGYYTLGIRNYPVVSLPVSLLSFDATINSEKVLVSWSTATEINSKSFMIQKSEDGKTFGTIATVKAAGNSGSVREYSVEDSEPSDGISYYRLVETDLDGKSTTFPVISVNNSLSISSSITVFPNPVSSADQTFYLTFPEEDKEVLVVVRDVQGQEFYSRVVIDVSAQELIPVSTEGRLVPGMYMVIASSDHHIYSKKFIVR